MCQRIDRRDRNHACCRRATIMAVRLALALAALLCGDATVPTEPQYTYFCAGETVPGWIMRASDRNVKITFLHDAIVVGENSTTVEVYPVSEISPTPTIIVNDREAIINGLISIRGIGEFITSGRSNVIHVFPLRRTGLPKKQCRVTVS